jgi:hypothetical protein
LDPSKDPEKNKEKLQKVAKKLLKDYPPEPKKWRLATDKGCLEHCLSSGNRAWIGYRFAADI